MSLSTRRPRVFDVRIPLRTAWTSIARGGLCSLWQRVGREGSPQVQPTRPHSAAVGKRGAFGVSGTPLREGGASGAAAAASLSAKVRCASSVAPVPQRAFVFVSSHSTRTFV